MPRDDSAQGRLWALIEARKEDRNDPSDSPARDGDLFGADKSNAALVDMLYRLQHAPDTLATAGNGTVRSQLQSVIAADAAARAFRRTRRGVRLELHGARQVFGAAALVAITIAAIAYTVWTTWRIECAGTGGYSQTVSRPSSVEAVTAAVPTVALPVHGAKALTKKEHMLLSVKCATAVAAPSKK